MRANRASTGDLHVDGKSRSTWTKGVIHMVGNRGPLAGATSKRQFRMMHPDRIRRGTMTWIRRALILDRRGVSTAEYALLICAILLVAAGGYRLLGKYMARDAQHAVQTLEGQTVQSEASNPTAENGGDQPVASNGDGGHQEPKQEHKGGGGFWGGVGKFFKGAVEGDFGDNGWQGALGQAVVGFIPIVGQIADARDTIAGIAAVVQGKPGGWEQLGGAAIAWVPGVGGVVKNGIKDARRVEEGAEAVRRIDKAAAHAGAKTADEAAAQGDKLAAKDGRLVDKSAGSARMPPSAALNPEEEARAISRLAAEDPSALKVIGRQPDTAVAKEWPGHDVLDIPNWSLQKNSEWVQKGIDGKQNFYLASPTDGNMVQTAGAFKGQPTIYALELKQLADAGYVKVGDYLVHPANVPRLAH